MTVSSTPGHTHARAADVPPGGPRLPSLSMILPVFNGVDWVEPTLERLHRALKAVPAWRDAEILVVDDGSDDGTAELLDRLAIADSRLRVVHQPNRGRFLARRAGLEASTGELVLLVDVRLFVHEAALRYLAEQLATHPERTVWNAHCEIDIRRNPYAAFWSAVTFVAWRGYLAKPRYVSYGEEDFDRYPKGTGGFVAPRQALLDAYASFTTYYDDLQRVNDDSALLRRIAGAHRINMAPGYAWTYHARGTFRQFLKHAHARGIHFVDGYLRRSSRYAWFIVAFLLATPIFATLLALQPVTVILGSALLVVFTGLAARGLGVPTRTVLIFVLLLPSFALVYGAGIWRGVLLAARARLRRSRR